MTERQSLRLLLLSCSNGDVPKAQSAYQFVMGDGDENDQPKQANPIKPQCTQDGVYIVYADGSAVLCKDGDKVEKDNCVGIGIIQGSRSLVVALHDASEDEVTLTSESDSTNDQGFYIDERIRAVADWNGLENTEHLKRIGLNKEIKLKDNEYIPSAGEMYLIYTHLLMVNAALRAVGGDALKLSWYWTSTEFSATGAWHLYLSNGGLYAGNKTSGSYYGRPVSAFPTSL